MVVQCAKHWSELGLTYCNFSSSNKGDEERKKKRKGKQIQGIFLLDPGLDYRQLECFTNKKVISPLHNITYPFLISERHLIFSISSKKRINLRMHSSLSFPLTPPHLAVSLPLCMPSHLPLVGGLQDVTIFVGGRGAGLTSFQIVPGISSIETSDPFLFLYIMLSRWQLMWFTY